MRTKALGTETSMKYRLPDSSANDERARVRGSLGDSNGRRVTITRDNAVPRISIPCQKLSTPSITPFPALEKSWISGAIGPCP